MRKEERSKKVEIILKEVFNRDDIVLHDDLSADDIEEWDSFAHLNLVMHIEQEFNVRFALGELQELKNIGEFLTLLEDKLS